MIPIVQLVYLFRFGKELEVFLLQPHTVIISPLRYELFDTQDSLRRGRYSVFLFTETHTNTFVRVLTMVEMSLAHSPTYLTSTSSPVSSPINSEINPLLAQ